jgi:hypothetical protein
MMTVASLLLCFLLFLKLINTTATTLIPLLEMMEKLLNTVAATMRKEFSKNNVS